MALERVTLESLCRLDGGIIAAAVNAALRQVADDMVNRPADDTPREVTLTIKCKPIADPEAGVLDYAEMYHTIGVKIPSRRTKTFRCGAGGGSLTVNDLSPRNPNQRTIDEIADGKSQAAGD